MKKYTFLALTVALPFASLAADGQSASERLYELALWSIIVVSVLAAIFGVGMVVSKAMNKKNEILNSNITRIKAELALKGYDPEKALIDILHKQSSIYKMPEPIVIYERALENELSTGEIGIDIVEVPADLDHSLALKVADELARIQKNLSVMDEDTKGLKQLSQSVERIANNFAANGYEIVQMLNKPYSEGMKVAANFVPSEELAKGQQLITRVIKPQVNYKGEMIQSAQIEVSVGE